MRRRPRNRAAEGSRRSSASSAPKSSEWSRFRFWSTCFLQHVSFGSDCCCSSIFALEGEEADGDGDGGEDEIWFDSSFPAILCVLDFRCVCVTWRVLASKMSFT
jgi:hypothetical protein